MKELKIHPHFSYPQPNAKLWRFMDVAKFLAMLEDSALFMTRADRFVDPYEGTITSYDKKNRNKLYSPGIVDAINRTDFFTELQRSRSYVNCWHQNDFESAAMWDLYTKSNEGIAIRTTFRNLSNSIIDDNKVWIGNVDYIDFNKKRTPRGNMYYPMFMKRKSFEHEREVRIFHAEHINDYYAGRAVPLNPKYEYGFNLKVELSRLIKEIYVAPNAPQWVFELVKKVVLKYGLQKNVFQSNLYKSPLS